MSNLSSNTNSDLASNLNFDSAYSLQTQILRGEMTTQEILSFLTQLESNPLTKSTFLAILQASKDHQVTLPTYTNSLSCLDIVGTGGDSLDTFNISSISALVCATVGISVAKHGNRSATSLCGSADFMEAVGYPLDFSPQQSAQMLTKTNFAFLFAPIYNPAFRYVKEARKLYGKPSYFNLLGPLLNPANPQFLVMGVSNAVSCAIPDCFEILSKQLSQTTRSWLVQSAEGMDEISTEQITNVYQPFGQNDAESRNQITQQIGQIPVLQPKLNRLNHPKSYRKVTIDPNRYNLQYPLSDIQTTGLEQNIIIFNNILNNTATPAQKSAVILNSAAGLTITNTTKTYKEAIVLAQELIESGQAKAKWQEILEELNNIKNQY